MAAAPAPSRWRHGPRPLGPDAGGPPPRSPPSPGSAGAPPGRAGQSPEAPAGSQRLATGVQPGQRPPRQHRQTGRKPQRAHRRLGARLPVASLRRQKHQPADFKGKVVCSTPGHLEAASPAGENPRANAPEPAAERGVPRQRRRRPKPCSATPAALRLPHRRPKQPGRLPIRSRRPAHPDHRPRRATSPSKPTSAPPGAAASPKDSKPPPRAEPAPLLIRAAARGVFTSGFDAAAGFRGERTAAVRGSVASMIR